jgi:hypothetical protein
LKKVIDFDRDFTFAADLAITKEHQSRASYDEKETDTPAAQKNDWPNTPPWRGREFGG